MSFNNEYRPGGFGFLPVVTKNIIIANVVLFLLTYLLQSTQGINLYHYLGLHYYLAEDFKPHQFVTYLFMHGDFRHLFFNMFGVFIFGQALEQVWGPKRYLTFYILTGFGAALAQYLIIHFEISDKLLQINEYINTPGVSVEEKSQLIDFKYHLLNNNLIIGASGSLFGLLGAFGILFPNQVLYLYFLFPIKVKWFVIIYGLIELISGLSNNPGDNVAHFAHLGGLFVGIIIVLIWRKNNRYYY